MTELYEQFFATPFFATEKPEWVDKLNKNSQPYLDDAHNNVEEKVKELGTDFGHVYHSVSIEDDPKLKYLTDYIGATAFNLLNTWGVDLSNFMSQVDIEDTFYKDLPPYAFGNEE